MNERLDLPENYELKLGQEKYVISKLVGYGGSSKVYKGFRNLEPVIIKELFPDDVQGIKRCNNHALIIPDYAKQAMDIYIKRAKAEYAIVSKLRLTDAGKDIDTWFKNYNEPVEANNTLYTVIDSEFGDILEDMMSDKSRNTTFADICELILRILEPLEPVHREGFLHLDISPGNIHVLKQAVGNKRIVKLLDFNNACHLDKQEEIDREIFVKKGYSAPELSRTTYAKDTNLTQAADLYSVVVIFFEFLMHRLPEPIDLTLFSRNESVVSNGYLRDMSGIVVKKTNLILKKGLRKEASNRYQTIAELRADIQELLELAKKKEPLNTGKRFFPYFVCREKELEQIHTLLNKDNYVFLEGMGGIGKSELAKKYAWDRKDEYNIIQFITFNESLQKTIAVSLEINNFEKSRYDQLYKKEEVIPQMFKDKMACLSSCDEKTLIVLDNFDVEDDDALESLLFGKYKVIFTSRAKHDGYTCLEVRSLESESDLQKLFYTYYRPSEEPTANDENFIRKIIELVMGHTMTVMLIASAMRVNNITPNEMLSRLADSLDPELLEKVSMKKEEIKAAERKQIMYQHLLNLFDMDKYCKDEQENAYFREIMTNMAIVPYTGMKIDLFTCWSSYNESLVHKLIELRWIQYDDTGHISLHPVVSDVANSKLKPDSEKCESLLHNFLEFACDCYEKTYIERIAAADMLELACKRLNEEVEPVAYLMGSFAFLNESLARYVLALEYYKKYAKMLEEISSADYFDTTSVDYATKTDALESVVRVMNTLGRYDEALEYRDRICWMYNDEAGSAKEYHALGKVYDNKGNIGAALDCYNKAFDIRKRICHEDHPDIAQSYNDIGHVYAKLFDYDNALYNFKEALRIGLKYFGEESALTATAHSNIGVILLDMERPDEAIVHLSKALYTEMKLYGENHPSTAKTHMNYGGYYFMKGDYQKALEMFKKSLTIYEIIFLKGHSDIAQLNALIGEIYFVHNEYNKALRYSEKSLKIYQEISGDESLDTAKAYNDAATIYFRMGIFNTALEYYVAALKIAKNVLPDHHHTIIQSIEENIEAVQSFM